MASFSSGRMPVTFASMMCACANSGSSRSLPEQLRRGWQVDRRALGPAVGLPGPRIELQRPQGCRRHTLHVFRSRLDGRQRLAEPGAQGGREETDRAANLSGVSGILADARDNEAVGGAANVGRQGVASAELLHAACEQDPDLTIALGHLVAQIDIEPRVERTLHQFQGVADALTRHDIDECRHGQLTFECVFEGPIEDRLARPVLGPRDDEHVSCGRRTGLSLVRIGCPIQRSRPGGRHDGQTTTTAGARPGRRDVDTAGECPAAGAMGGRLSGGGSMAERAGPGPASCGSSPSTRSTVERLCHQASSSDLKA